MVVRDSLIEFLIVIIVSNTGIIDDAIELDFLPKDMIDRPALLKALQNLYDNSARVQSGASTGINTIKLNLPLVMVPINV